MAKKHSASQAHSEGFKESCVGERVQKHIGFLNFFPLTTFMSWTLLEVWSLWLGCLNPITQMTCSDSCLYILKATFPLGTLTFHSAGNNYNIERIYSNHALSTRSLAGWKNKRPEERLRTFLAVVWRKNTPGCLYWCFNQLQHFIDFSERHFIKQQARTGWQCVPSAEQAANFSPQERWASLHSQKSPVKLSLPSPSSPRCLSPGTKTLSRLHFIWGSAYFISIINKRNQHYGWKVWEYLWQCCHPSGGSVSACLIRLMTIFITLLSLY